MSIGSESRSSALESLSALIDGELDSNEVMRACSAWRDDISARSTWHAYQLIGDVLRSDDLANHAAHDAAFLATLRERLASEPVVLAPEPVAEPLAQPAGVPAWPEVARAAHAGRHRRWTWVAPSAVAAGFVMVAGALLVTRTPLPQGGTAADSLLARGGSGAAPTRVVNAPALAAADASIEPQALRPTGKVIRDSQLDRYLAAHQQFAGTSALGVPSGFLRNAAAEMPNR
jgi:sigma-E factor negative regulatory protein RseA